MKNTIIIALIYFYTEIKASNLIRKLIKKLIGSEKVILKFNSFKIYAGVKTALEIDVVFNNYNEMRILKIIEIFALKGYDFIDAGANIGLHSLTAAQSNRTIEIYSFEPEPENYNDFIKNINLNGFYNIRPFKLGLGNKNENKYLNINEEWNKGKHSLKINFAGTQKSIKIPLLKLNTFEDTIKNDSLVIKIDVEGYEYEVIEGARSIIDKTSNIVLIIELLEQNNSRETCNKIVDLLVKSKFDFIYKIENNQLKSVLSFEESSDYIFIKGKNSVNILNLVTLSD